MQLQPTWKSSSECTYIICFLFNHPKDEVKWRVKFTVLPCLFKNQEKSWSVPAEVNTVMFVLWSWLHPFIFYIFKNPGKWNTVCISICISSVGNILTQPVFLGYKISVLILHLPSSQLFVAADLQNKYNTEQIEVHAEGIPYPTAPLLKHSQLMRVDFAKTKFTLTIRNYLACLV